MGDRCYMELRFRKQDAPKVREAFALNAGYEFDEEKDAAGVCVFEDEEANYAVQREREVLAAKGVAFVGAHGSGCEYDGGRFVAFGGQMIDVMCDKRGDLIAAVDPEMGKVNAEDLRVIRRYIALSKKAEKAIGIKRRKRARA